MQNRPNARKIQKLARKLAKAHKTMSYPQIAKAFGITTPTGAPNPRLVKWLTEGYRPSHEDTLRRSGLLADAPPVIHDEPARRVLTGPWKLDSRWVSPEEALK